MLWLFTEAALLTLLIVGLMEPGILEQVMAGEVLGMKIGPELLLILTIELLVPLVMAFLSLTLKDSINRWANIILGIVFVGLELLSLVEELANPSAHSILLWLSIVVALALIVWYAWKSKRKV